LASLAAKACHPTPKNPAAGIEVPGKGLVPGRLEQTVHSSFTLSNGQTACIGGLVQSSVRASITKIRVLGHLPLVGDWFSMKQYNEVEEELVLLLTAHVD
jgi:pilus assembly protein CpaC